MKTHLTILSILLAAVLQNAPAQVSPHGTIRYSCQTCHTTDSWKMRRDATFDHVQAGYILEGQHKTVDCAGCHKELKFSGTSRQCTSCHTDVHKSELGANCSRCHSQQAWKISDMVQRHQSTRFPLLGRHSTLICQDCHAAVANNQYAGTPTTCIGCHRTDFENSKNPNHVGAGFSTDCQQCHKVTSFAWGSGFDHNITAFPLIGAHTSTVCSSCHKNAVFKNTTKDCFVCHQPQYQSSTNPNHVLAGIPTTCQTCHSPVAWRPSTFTHDNTKFPLMGAHRAVQCADCHKNNQYSNLATNCVDCHQTDFAGTTNPNHQTNNFPHTCLQCHTMTAWKPASFDHSTTKFALTGSHVAIPCQSCHTNSNYQLVYTDCYQCHQTDFAKSTTLNHVTNNISHLCLTCHTTAVWLPSTFNHSSTKFALTGTHTTTPCAGCHVNGNYTISYTDCYQCHQTDFAKPTNPNHVATSMNHACSPCHTTTAWLPSTFAHDAPYFKIYSGKHRGQWTLCTECHASASSYTSFTCINCHQHNSKAKADADHQGKTGYTYTPTSCYDCHKSI